MLENTATQDFSIEHAICFEKQLQATQNDLYGGSANNWPGAGDKMQVKANVEVQTGREYFTDVSANGTQFTGAKRITAEMPSAASITTDGWVQGLERLLLAAMGYASVAGPVSIPSSPSFYRHFFVIPPQGRNQRKYTDDESILAGDSYEDDDDIKDTINTYLCISQKLGPYAQHVRNVVIKEAEISCSAKDSLQLTMSGPAERIDREDTKESTKNWSISDGAFKDWFQLSDFQCFLGPAGTNAAACSITEFSAKISHGLSDDNTPTGTSNNGLSRAEPLPSGKSSVTLDLTVYLHDKTIYEDWAKNETILTCKLEATRGQYKFAILFPRLAITQVTPNFDGAGSIQFSLEASWPNSEAELEAIRNSFATERGNVDWPLTSLMGVLVTSKENRNPMRGMEVTETTNEEE
ncbi:MAG: hypothetical protein LBU89_07620 [Fibromonadaceae bacterium]|jgi:hypothetical protein|nr:hypothetical protein [Fibromonadaceae bacterium]